MFNSQFVIPAKAGIPNDQKIPAFAGMTVGGRGLAL